MTLKIIHKNNTSTGQAPASGDLDIGEIAVNSADAKLYTKDNNGAVQEFISKFEQAGSGAVTRTVESKLQDVVSVKDFGAVGNGTTDDTAAMQAAHNTGKIVYYPAGTYIFSTLTIESGGIIGGGTTTILKTTDTGFGDVITYTGVDPTGVLVNTVGGLFQDFTLLAATATQKTTGAGIAVSTVDGGPERENYLTTIENIYVRNLPTSVYFSLASFFSVSKSYFSFYSVAGLHAEIDSLAFRDNGDNKITDNWFFTNAATGPSARGIWYRCGGAQIIGNKINGGMIGVDINPLYGTSVAIVQGNSVENQTINAIRGYINSDFTSTGVFDGYSFLHFTNNQIGGYNLTGPAISINSYASDPKFYNCQVSGNVIYNSSNTTSRTIDIRQVDRFSVVNNFVDSAAVGYGSLYVDSSATQGLVQGNQFLRAATSNFLNNSSTTIVNQIISQKTATLPVGTIPAGDQYVGGIGTPANFGDYATASTSADVGNCLISSYVYALNAVKVIVYNPTASPIAVGDIDVSVRVFSA